MDPAFAVHMLNEAGKRKASVIAAAFNALLDELMEFLPPGGREVALLRTKLEEACFYAKKAMASEKGNQEIT